MLQIYVEFTQIQNKSRYLCKINANKAPAPSSKALKAHARKMHTKSTQKARTCTPMFIVKNLALVLFRPFLK